MSAGQLELDTPVCKTRDCTGKVVGHSTTGKGQVCKRCNAMEWGKALASHPSGMYRELGLAVFFSAVGRSEGRKLLREARVRL